MNRMQMTKEQFDRYCSDPLKHDDDVRRLFGVPENRYYTVSTWPVEGVVIVDTTRHRIFVARKISKSNQP